MATLELRYGDHQQHRHKLYRAQLLQRMQKAGESLPEYWSDIRRLVYLAYVNAPDWFQDRLAAQHFVDGIRDEEIRKELRLTTFLQSSQALVRALEVEAAFSISGSKVRAVIQEDEERTDNAAMMSRIEKMFQQMLETCKQEGTAPTSPDKYTKDRRCSRCGKTGHFIRDCRVQMHSRTLSTSEFGRRNNRLTIEGSVDRKKTVITFDTGSARSIIRSSVAEGRRIKPLSQNLVLRTVTGETAAVLGEVEVELQLGSLRLFPRVLVADIEDEFILGMDLIWRYGLAFDSRRNTLRFGSEKFVLSRGKEDPVIPIRAVEIIKVPSVAEKDGSNRDPGSCVGLVQQPQPKSKRCVRVEQRDENHQKEGDRKRRKAAT